MSKAISTILGGALLLTGVASAAQAGGLERGGYNWELLFEPGRFATEAGVIYVMPDRRIKNAVDTRPIDGRGATASVAVRLPSTKRRTIRFRVSARRLVSLTKRTALPPTANHGVCIQIRVLIGSVQIRTSKPRSRATITA